LGVIISRPEAFFSLKWYLVKYNRSQARIYDFTRAGVQSICKAPREWVWGGAVPSPEYLCIFYIKMVSFYAFLVIIIDTNCKPLREKTLAFNLQINNCSFVCFMLIAVKVRNEKLGPAICFAVVTIGTSCSSCFVFTKQPVHPTTCFENMFFSNRAP